MPEVILPASVILRDATERLNARHDHLRWLEQELRSLDPLLSLVRAKPTVAPGSPLKPGYWYIQRANPVGGAPQMIEWAFPDGSFREPDSGMLEFLRRRDLWNPGVFEHAKKAQQRQEAETRARAAEQRGELRDELAGRVKAAVSPGVSLAAKHRKASKA